MKNLRSVVAFTALVNLLALGIFAGWLGGTGRLSLERVRAIRDILAVPVAEEEAAAARAAAEAAARAEAAAETDRRERPSLDSDSMVRMAGMTRSVEEASVRRIEDEAERIRRDLARREADLARREQRLADDRAAWLASIEADRTRREDAAFTATVARFEALKPDAARAMLQRWVDAGELEVAVDVLMAVDERNAAKVLGSFADEAGRGVAFQLLDGVRRRGRLLDGAGAGAASDGSPADDDDFEPAAQPNGGE